MMLSCIAAVAIATVVGKKTFESHAYETNNLLMQNVEALSTPSDDGGINKKGCKTNSTIIQRTDICIHGHLYGFSGIYYTCTEGNDSTCTYGYDGTDILCQGAEHMPMQLSPSTRPCK